MPLKQSASRYKQELKYFLKFDLFLVSMKEEKSELVAIFEGIKVKIIFI